MPYPTAWTDFNHLIGSQNGTTLEYANMFASRYRFATSLDGISAVGIGGAARTVYQIGLRVLTVQTTLEALDKVTGSQVSLSSSEIAQRLRRDPGLLHLMLETDGRHTMDERKRGQDEAIRSLADGAHDDLAPVLERLRDMIAHGDITGHRFGLDRRADRRQLFQDLAEEGLQAADRAFTRWVTGLHEEPVPNPPSYVDLSGRPPQNSPEDLVARRTPLPLTKHTVSQ